MQEFGDRWGAEAVTATRPARATAGRVRMLPRACAGGDDPERAVASFD
jgi:hypothetical protein